MSDYGTPSQEAHPSPRKTNTVFDCPCPDDHADVLAQRFVVTEGGCWEWTLKPNAYGYGILSHRSVPYQAHRTSYEIATGEPLPSELDIDHLCRNRICVNPDHLEPVPPSVNLQRSWKWRGHVKTHGTRTRYVADKCRCTPCREANREYERNRRAVRQESDLLREVS